MPSRKTEMKLNIVMLAGILSAAAGMYDSSDAVIQLTDKDFNKRVLQDSGLWLVEVYAPWCGHCKNLAPAWKEAAKALKGIVNVAAVDGTAHESIAQKLGVKGFPTIKVYGSDKNAPIDYPAGRDADSIVDYALKEASRIAKERLKGKSKSSGSKPSGSKQSGGGGGGGHGADAPGGGKHVITLTDADFDELVLNSQEPWLVEFYAPWCGHCKHLAPDWAEAAEELQGVFRLGALDATAHPGKAAQYEVKGYPTIKYFPAGKKTARTVQDYKGGRSAGEIIAFAHRALEATGGAPAAVEQVTSPDVWEAHCTGKRICVLTFLPHILDDGAEKRNARLATLAEAASSAGQRNLFRFLWSEIGAQPELEKTLNIGLVPAVIAISTEKKVYTPYRGAFDASHLTSFVKGLTIRNEGAMSLKDAQLPTAPGQIASVDKWDGKDGKAGETEPEISLEDLGL